MTYEEALVKQKGWVKEPPPLRPDKESLFGLCVFGYPGRSILFYDTQRELVAELNETEPLVGSTYNAYLALAPFWLMPGELEAANDGT